MQLYFCIIIVLSETKSIVHKEASLLSLLNYFYFTHKPIKFLWGNLIFAKTIFRGVHRSVRFRPLYCTSATSAVSRKVSLNVARATRGRHVCLSKGSRQRFRRYTITAAGNSLSYFFSILQVHYNPILSKFFGLVISGNCQYSVIPLTSRMTLFQLSIGCLFFSTFAWGREHVASMKRARHCDCVLYIPLQASICLLSSGVHSYPTYIRAAGCAGNMLRKLLHASACAWVLVRLPSGYIKAFVASTGAFFGFVLLHERLQQLHTHAGFSRRLGHSPRVRGVVKNPIDHPHGGRERTVLWPRSPWGRSTK